MGPSEALLGSFLYCLDENESLGGGGNEHLLTSCQQRGGMLTSICSQQPGKGLGEIPCKK